MDGSSVAMPISLILAFFGINASQVDADRSMFDPGYGVVYAGVGLLAVIAVLLALTLYAHQIRQLRGGAPAGRPPMVTPSRLPVPGPRAAERETSPAAR